MDLEVQDRVKQLAEEYSKNDLVVLLDAPNIDAARVQFETMTREIRPMPALWGGLSWG